MSYGYKDTGYEDDWRMARVAHKCFTSPKNRCNVLIYGHAVGSWKTIKYDGVAGACSNIERRTVVHEPRTKRWCIHTDRHNIDGVISQVGTDLYI